jgi:ABC-type oligopeptide transport system substrate-binding subunit
LRKRIAQLLGRALAEHAPRETTPAVGLIPPGLIGHSRARRRLTSKKEGTGPIDSVELTAAVLNHPTGLYTDTARVLFSALEREGVRVRTVNTTNREFFDALDSGSVDLVLGRWTATYPDADCFAHGLYDPHVGTLRRFFQSTELESFVRRTRAETDSLVRRALYRDFEQVLITEALMVPLFHEKTYRFARPEVEGLRISLIHPLVSYDELYLRR